MPKRIKKRKPNKKPDVLNQTSIWNVSRRDFLGSIMAGGLFCIIPSTSSYGLNIDSQILSSDQLLLVASVQGILFPSDGNGPGAHDIMAERYLLWVLSDIRIDPEEKEYVINGIGWVDETAEEYYFLKYNQLSQKQKEELIEDISKEDWGRSWLGVILNFIFEALLSDPQYGGNPDEIGWNWLDHNPGHPRPEKSLLYPEILITVSDNYQTK
jgi:gluconate 2-dehydrogenase gamma chain